MAGQRTPGPLGGSGPPNANDPGTLTVSATPPPGPVGGAGPGAAGLGGTGPGGVGPGGAALAGAAPGGAGFGGADVAHPTLHFGRRGAAVVELQSRLGQVVASQPTITVDGIFGPETERTVRAFQRAQWIGVDGIVGPITWGRLLKVTEWEPERPEGGAAPAAPEPAPAPAVAKAPAAAPLPAPKPAVARKLRITKIDDHFAPQAESLAIEYLIAGLDGEEVTLRLKDRDGTVIFERPLDDGEKADGNNKPLSWDGLVTQGKRSGRHATPLMCPFKAELEGGGLKDTAKFKILYHSIELQQGPWTADETEPAEANERAWVAWKLNDLGYWGGPVGTDYDGYFDRAIIRYKVNHPALHKLKYHDYDASITAPLKAALKAGDVPRSAIVGDAFADPAGTCKIYVEEITYEGAEFGQERGAFETKRVNRPLLPIEATVYLKSKDDEAANAPDAVGAVRINWRHSDTDEDLSTQVANVAAAPSHTAAYLEKAFKLEGGRAGNGDNCPKDLGGIREGPGTNYRTPFVRGSTYVPYTVEDDSGEKVVYTRACDDAAKYPQRLGRAGALFRPSRIGGDDYKLRAEIDFKGCPNRSELEGYHKVTSLDSRIHADTGTFTIWRTAKVAAVINWPTRTKPPATWGAHEWGEIATEFEHAYIELDVSDITSVPIADAMDEATYKNLVARYTMFTDKSKIRLEPDAMIGVDLPRQGKLRARQYRKQLRAFSSAMFNALNEPLGRTFSRSLRKTKPTGFIIATFFVHKPVDIETAPATGDHSVAPNNVGMITWASSIGLADSVILYDMKDPDKPYYVTSHEMGHNFYLLHWENTGESNLSHHDRSDHNCTMSYSASGGAPAHQAPGVYTPHFCGKCNLKLRGWKVTSGVMPAKS